MAILAAINEGSEEARQKRAVRRYLNKKKDKRPVDESTDSKSSWLHGVENHIRHSHPNHKISWATLHLIHGSGKSPEEGANEYRKQLKLKGGMKEETVDEMTFHVGSVAHMMQAVHGHHVHGHDQPHYHIHKIGLTHSTDTGLPSVHHYLVVHRMPIAHANGERNPVHHFRTFQNSAGQHEVEHARQLV